METLEELKEMRNRLNIIINKIEGEAQPCSANDELMETLIRKTIDENNCLLDEKVQKDLFGRLRAINKANVSVINLLKKFQIKYEYVEDGKVWKTIKIIE